MDETRGVNGVDALTETLAGGGRDAFDAVAEEFAARCRGGDAPSISEYVARYPEHAGLIRKLLPTVAMMEQLKRDTRSDDAPLLGRAMPERFGEFRIVRELGRGGMGVVYEAVQESLGRNVALKVVHEVRLDAKRLQRFEREARAIAHLHHTNIVPIFAVGEQDGLPYYAMQYIQGIGLDVLLGAWRRTGAPLGEERWRLVARVGMQAAAAFQYAHEQGVLHRDVKPANLLLDAYQSVWVTDFGLAKLAGQDDLTASGDVVGTLRYLAPEALRGESDARSDVYSLGLTLYELLTLSPPFGDLSQSELLRRVSEGEPERPRNVDPGIPRDLETIVLKATAREPAHRYRSAGELADDLKRFMEDRPVAARRATFIERAWRWARRNPGTAALAGAAAGALVLAGVVGWAGYASTSAALAKERIATRRAEENVALSLKVFGKLFETLAAEDDVLPPALGRQQHEHPPPRPDDGNGPGHGPPPPRGPGEVDAGARLRPPDEPRRRFGRPLSQENAALLGSVLEFYEQFARDNATNPKLQGEAAWAYRKVGALYGRLGRADEAENAYARAITMFEQLVARHPADPEYRFKLVQTYDMADPNAAEGSSLERTEWRLDRAQALIDRLVAESPANVPYRAAQAHVCAKHGAVLQQLDQTSAAEACYRRAIELDAALIDRAPAYDRPRLDRATTRESLALLLHARGERHEGLAELGAAAEELAGLASRSLVPPPVAGRLGSLADAFDRFGAADRAAEMRGLAAAAEAKRPGPPGGSPGHGPRPPRAADARP